MAQDREILWGMAAPNATGIFVEADVQTPVQLVLDFPMTAHRVLELQGRAGQAANVVTRLYERSDFHWRPWRRSPR